MRNSYPLCLRAEHARLHFWKCLQVLFQCHDILAGKLGDLGQVFSQVRSIQKQDYASKLYKLQALLAGVENDDSE